MSVVKITKENFEKIKNGEKDITVGKINVDDSPELAAQFSVYSIPTLVVLKEGKTYRQVTGARSKEAILALLD